jgi:hypothetical protein
LIWWQPGNIVVTTFNVASPGFRAIAKIGASGHAFQNAYHLNAPLLHQVMLFKLPAF